VAITSATAVKQHHLAQPIAALPAPVTSVIITASVTDPRARPIVRPIVTEPVHHATAMAHARAVNHIIPVRLTAAAPAPPADPHPAAVPPLLTCARRNPIAHRTDLLGATIVVWAAPPPVRLLPLLFPMPAISAGHRCRRCGGWPKVMARPWHQFLRR